MIPWTRKLPPPNSRLIAVFRTENGPISVETFYQPDAMDKWYSPTTNVAQYGTPLMWTPWPTHPEDV